MLGDLLSAGGLNKWFGLPTNVAGASLGGNWAWKSGITNDTLVGDVTKSGKYNEFTAIYTPTNENKNNYAWEALKDYWDGQAKALTARLQVEVIRSEIEGIEIKLSQSEFVYDGTEKMPVLTITKEDTKEHLEEGTDYDAVYPKDRINAGRKQVKLTFKGSYEGEVSRFFTIAPKEITVKANDASKKYGEADPELKYTAEGMVDKDKLAGQLIRAEGENVGSYEISAVSLDNPNYNITFNKGVFTINRKEITVKANDASKKYREADPELKYTADGLVGEDKLEGQLSRQSGEDAGTYEITQGELNNAKNPNYDIKFTKGTFTIIGNKTQTVVTLSEKEITLKAGQTHRLTAKISPAAAENEPLVWTSDNPAAAQVTPEGEVKGIAPGTTAITAATADGKSQDSCVVTVEVDKSGWGERIERNEIEMYVDDEGTTSVESSKNGIIWAKEEFPENQTWYGLDNRSGDFTQGSRFWVRGITKKENPEEWQEYWAQVDEEYKSGINEEQCWIFLVGVTNPNGEEYEQLKKPTNLYVQIGNDWDYESLKGLYISSEGNENINVRYAEDQEYPEDSGAFCVMELNHFSPYLVYAKSAKQGSSEQEKVEVPKKEISKAEQKKEGKEAAEPKKSSKEVKKSQGFQTGDEASYVQISAIVINLLMSFYMVLKFRFGGKK